MKAKFLDSITKAMYYACEPFSVSLKISKYMYKRVLMLSVYYSIYAFIIY